MVKLVLCGLVVGMAAWAIRTQRRRRVLRAAPRTRADREETRRTVPSILPEPPALPEHEQPPGLAPEPPSQVKSCPVCLTEYDFATQFCTADGAELMIASTGTATLAQGMICPTCRRSFASDNQFCPHDADELVPFGLFAASHAVEGSAPPLSRKICPECGHRYPTNQRFCQQDGTPLVVVN